jgi:hypothetical protein
MIQNLKPILPPATVPVAGAQAMVRGWYEYFVQLDDRVRKLLTQGNRAETGVVVSALPTGQSAGARSFVTNATATTFGSVVAGGGTNKVPTYFDGTDWRIG